MPKEWSKYLQEPGFAKSILETMQQNQGGKTGYSLCGLSHTHTHLLCLLEVQFWKCMEPIAELTNEVEFHLESEQRHALQKISNSVLMKTRRRSPQAQLTSSSRGGSPPRG